MSSSLETAKPKRPIIGEYTDVSEFVCDMVAFRKATERSFSVHRATKGLRRVSPALVSLVMQKKRNLTADRVDEFARLLDLNLAEKLVLKKWIGALDGKDFLESPGSSKRDTSVSILSDWINLYVKDFFHIPAVQSDPDLVFELLRYVAPAARVKRAIDFLLREGHLRRTPDGRVVIEANLTVTDPGVPSKKIRLLHKGALVVAKQAMDLFPPSERMANTFILATNAERLAELHKLVEEFRDRLQELTSLDVESADRIYQVIVNLSPLGRRVE